MAELSTMVNKFKCVSAFSPFLASSKRAKMIHLIFSRTSSRTSCVDIMTRKDNDWQVVIGNTRETGCINCVENTGPDLFCQLRPQCLLYKYISIYNYSLRYKYSVRDVSWRLLCQSIAIDERLLCGYRLIID